MRAKIVIYIVNLKMVVGGVCVFDVWSVVVGWLVVFFFF